MGKLIRKTVTALITQVKIIMPQAFRALDQTPGRNFNYMKGKDEVCRYRYLD
jgi:hypothetical protein